MSTLATPQTAITTWNIDPVHTVAEFKVKHMMISNVKGQFTGIKGVLALDETSLANSHVEASVEACLHQYARTSARCASQERRFF